MANSEEVTLALVRAARAFDVLGLRTRFRHDSDAFGAFALLLERAAPCKLHQRIPKLDTSKNPRCLSQFLIQCVDDTGGLFRR